MLMIQKTNLEIAALINGWIEENVEGKRGIADDCWRTSCAPDQFTLVKYLQTTLTNDLSVGA